MRALRNKQREENDGGFTLIELLLVIIILGILAAVVVFSVRGVSDRGQASACKTSKQTTIAALETYYAQNNIYPADLDQLRVAGLVAEGGLPNLSVDKRSLHGPEKGNNTPPNYEWTITYVLDATGKYTLPTSGPEGSSC